MSREEELWLTCISMQLEAEIPDFPESVNHLYGSRGAFRFKKPKAKAWESTCWVIVRSAAIKAYGTADLSSLKGLPIKLELFFMRPSWTSKKGLYVRPDISNFIKSAEDAVCRSLGLDDSAVVEITAKKIKCSHGDVRTKVRMTFQAD